MADKQVILCIDDEELILEALEEQLNNYFGEEYDIETADNGEDALEFFKELREDGIEVPVIISDYIMPGMKGDEVLKEIHKISPHSLKILLTGQASIEGIGNAINNAQLYRFITKPWDKDDLVLTVKEAVKSFFQEQKIKKQNQELRELNASLEEKVRQRTEELLQANAAKDKFFSIIAHDLKNPFNSLFGLTEFMIDNWDILTDEDKKETIKDLHASSKVTYNLLQNLLQWSRAQTGRLKVEPSEFDAWEVAEENIRVLTKHANSKNIVLKNRVEPQSFCFADRNMISTVFRNIISNAIKFTEENGEIVVNVEQQENTFRFCVADNGIGMDEDTLSKLFSITEKVQRSGTANEEGTGLGLILCKEFIEKNGGSITVESEPGKGSKFFFTVPRPS